MVKNSSLYLFNGTAPPGIYKTYSNKTETSEQCRYFTVVKECVQTILSMLFKIKLLNVFLDINIVTTHLSHRSVFSQTINTNHDL